jgi:hypothetical protein
MRGYQPCHPEATRRGSLKDLSASPAGPFGHFFSSLF